MSSHELLFPTDDLRSQHNSSRVHTALGLLVAFFSHATRLASCESGNLLSNSIEEVYLNLIDI
jgi:hypothetical protein